MSAAHDHADGHSHNHDHDHGSWGRASDRIRIVLAAILIPLAILTLVGAALLWPGRGENAGSLSGPGLALNDLSNATVTRVDARQCQGIDAELQDTLCLINTVDLTSGKEKGSQVQFQTSTSDGSPLLKQGDRIVVVKIPGFENASKDSYAFYNYQRAKPLLLLFLGFVLTAIVVGRKHGLRALISLAISMAVLLKFVLPSILDGNSPLLVALVGGSLVMFLTLYLSHGVNARSTSAIIGTVVSLALTGILARTAVAAARFTGLVSEDTNYLRATSENVDLRGLLLAGIIIGALGVFDDVTVTQAFTVWEIHQADPERGVRELFASGMRVGRSHIASTVNTLVLAYAGAALPLLLLFTQAGVAWSQVALEESVAEEIVRTLAGSIGLMASVPITTALTAAIMVADRRRDELAECDDPTHDHVH